MDRDKGCRLKLNFRIREEIGEVCVNPCVLNFLQKYECVYIDSLYEDFEPFIDIEDNIEDEFIPYYEEGM